MGAWDVGSFDNDDALQWLETVEQPGPLSLQVFFDTFAMAIPSASELITNDCCYVLAAADVLTSALGRGRPGEYADAISDLASRFSSPIPSELVELAIEATRAVERDSMLCELWEGDPDWHSDVADLIHRLHPFE